MLERFHVALACLHAPEEGQAPNREGKTRRSVQFAEVPFV